LDGFVNVRQSPIPATDPTESKYIAGFLAAAANAGVSVPLVNDYNIEPHAVGQPDYTFSIFSAPQLTQQTAPGVYGNRANSSISFLDSVITLSSPVYPLSATGYDGRPLLILFNSNVLTILFEGTTATGIRFLHNGIVRNAYAKKKVIVSAGINTVSILQRSGVGPAAVLAAADVPVIVDNENVGVGLQDQAFNIAIFTRNPADVSPDPISNRMGSALLPDPQPTADKTIRALQLTASLGAASFFIFTFLLRPQSSGTIKIFNPDPLRPPLPNPNYLTNIADLNTMAASMVDYVLPFSVAIHAIDPLYVLTSPAASTITNPALLTAWLRANTTLAYHWTSSCKMGAANAGGAVDGFGNVYGANNLVVADDTIAPLSNGGNTQTIAYLIGWQIASDLIAGN